MDIQAAAILTLSVVNGIVLIVLAASRADASHWKERASVEKSDRYKYHDQMILMEEKLSRQNRLIRAMALNDGFTDPLDDDDDR